MFNFINRLGVEIEGAWHERFADVEIHSDESVYCPPTVSKSTGHWGEVATPWGGVTYVDAVKFIKTHLPDGVFSGDMNGRHYTCGMHFHVSLQTASGYARLVTKDFVDYFYAECEKWGKEVKLGEEHEFWGRVAGKNRFCKRAFKPHAQLGLINKRNNEDRRTGINFPYALHGTVEFRLFPQFVKGEESLAVGVLDLTVNAIENFLANNPPSWTKVKNTVWAKDFQIARKVRKELLV